MTTEELRERCETFANELVGDSYGYDDHPTVTRIREAPGCHDAKGVILSKARELEGEATMVREFAESLPDDLKERWER
jgi:hypothetical protein